MKQIILNISIFRIYYLRLFKEIIEICFKKLAGKEDLHILYPLFPNHFPHGLRSKGQNQLSIFSITAILNYPG